MIFRAFAALIAAAMLISFLAPVVFKLVEIPLFVIAGIGITMMAVELWESYRDRQD